MKHFRSAIAEEGGMGGGEFTDVGRELRRMAQDISKLDSKLFRLWAKNASPGDVFEFGNGFIVCTSKV